MAQKNATLRAFVGQTLYDLMPKGSVYNIYVDENTTLASKLAEVIISLNGKVTPEQLKAEIQKVLEEAKASGEFDGPAGPQGEKGEKGEKGDTGEAGPQGPAGADGAKGDTGPQGPAGEAGPAGPQGETGARGPEGPQGPAGEAGPEGPQGPKGDTGETGPQGPKGDSGTAGKDGVSVTHEWNGTTLFITSASGTSYADLKGNKGDTGDTGPQGETGAPGYTPVKGLDYSDGTSVTVKKVTTSSADGGSNVVEFSDGKTLTVKNGSKGSTGETGPQGPAGDTGDTGPQGETGQRGTGILKVTTAPASYTTAIGSYTPKYRIAISTVKTQSGASEVLVGDTLLYSYYHYYVDYLDSSYAYISATRVSIRGATGSAGTTPVKGTDYYTAADKAEMVTEVKAALPTLTVTGVDADGVSHSWTVYGVAQ